MDKPRDMFDRDFEWEGLRKFSTTSYPESTLGIVYGRRRQGKTFLLRALCEATGGFYFGAAEATDVESLRRIGEALTEYRRSPAPFRFNNWFEVADVLLTLGNDRSVPVVIDEFPYLAKANPELPSIFQHAWETSRPEKLRSRTRLLLCGSAMSFMGRLLAGQAPLRGRASLELVVHTLNYRHAAQFWEISDPKLAFLVHSIVGGTPAYRRDFINYDTPRDIDDFDSWVTRTVLNPGVPLFREARYLLSEELEVRDPALYLSVLGAVVAGNTTRGAIASYVQRPSGDITRPIQVLEDAGLLRRDQDLFRKNRSTYHVAEPLLVFYHAIMRPSWDMLEQPGLTDRMWRTRRRVFECQILGPHFERICRDWMLSFSSPEMFDDIVARVGHGTVNDPDNRTTHDVDVAALGVADNGKPPLLAIGEAKWNDEMGRAHLERLERIKELIRQAGQYDVSSTRLLCFSGTGFNDHLRAQVAKRSDVSLVGLDELYGLGD